MILCVGGDERWPGGLRGGEDSDKSAAETGCAPTGPRDWSIHGPLAAARTLNPLINRTTSAAAGRTEKDINLLQNVTRKGRHSTIVASYPGLISPSSGHLYEHNEGESAWV